MDLLNSVSGGTEEGHTQNELKKVNKAEIIAGFCWTVSKVKYRAWVENNFKYL